MRTATLQEFADWVQTQRLAALDGVAAGVQNGQVDDYALHVDRMNRMFAAQQLLQEFDSLLSALQGLVTVPVQLTGAAPGQSLTLRIAPGAGLRGDA